MTLSLIAALSLVSQVTRAGGDARGNAPLQPLLVLVPGDEDVKTYVNELCERAQEGAFRASFQKVMMIGQATGIVPPRFAGPGTEAEHVADVLSTLRAADADVKECWSNVPPEKPTAPQGRRGRNAPTVPSPAQAALGPIAPPAAYLYFKQRSLVVDKSVIELKLFDWKVGHQKPQVIKEKDALEVTSLKDPLKAFVGCVAWSFLEIENLLNGNFPCTHWNFASDPASRRVAQQQEEEKKRADEERRKASERETALAEKRRRELETLQASNQRAADQRRKRARTIEIAIGGGGAAVAAIGVTCYLVANAKVNAIDRAIEQDAPYDPSNGNYRGWRDAGITLGVVGAAAGTFGLVHYLLNREFKPAPLPVNISPQPLRGGGVINAAGAF